MAVPCLGDPINRGDHLGHYSVARKGTFEWSRCDYVAADLVAHDRRQRSNKICKEEAEKVYESMRVEVTYAPIFFVSVSIKYT